MICLSRLSGRDRTSRARQPETAEKVGERVISGPGRARMMARKAADAEGLGVNALEKDGKGREKWWRRGESNPRPKVFRQQ